MPTSSPSTSPPVLGDPHEILGTDFPSHGSPADQRRFLLHYAALAPSMLNTQPWRFAAEHNTVRFYTDRKRQLHRVAPDGRELTPRLRRFTLAYGC